MVFLDQSQESHSFYTKITKLNKAIEKKIDGCSSTLEFILVKNVYIFVFGQS